MENPTKQSRYNNIANDNKPILVYEELSDHPQKFYGKKVGTISSTIEQPGLQSEVEIPNYAFMIFDVSLSDELLTNLTCFCRKKRMASVLCPFRTMLNSRKVSLNLMSNKAKI